MSHKAQKQNMHGQHSKRKMDKDSFIAPVKDFFRKFGSCTPSPSPQGTLAEPSATVNTDVPTASSQEPSRMPIISMYLLISFWQLSIWTFSGPQASAFAMVTPMEGAASPPNIHDGANIASTTANQTEISENAPGGSKLCLQQELPALNQVIIK
ncbi:hypothetical protein C0992_011861 [Termitomyces sp. T32_za158]|nr:hypothetical protein C0992_011861 [Termitomyces sp. T32_za158]